MKNNPFILGLIGALVFAHQPVMDMAPRWNGGYGFQVRYERFGSDRTIHEQNILSSYFQQTYWLEGVYTWHRAKRITFKLPYHMIERQDADLVAKAKSFGDLILAVPLKKYTNYKRRTQNFGFTPQIRIPLNEEITSASGYLGGGISLSYSSESFSFYQLYDVFGWMYNEKDPLLGLDINLGIHPYHDNTSNTGLFAMWDVTGRWQETSTRILTGPVFMTYRQNIMVRLDVKLPMVENGKKTQLSKGLFMNVGIGLVF